MRTADDDDDGDDNAAAAAAASSPPTPPDRVEHRDALWRELATHLLSLRKRATADDRAEAADTAAATRALEAALQRVANSAQRSHLRRLAAERAELRLAAHTAPELARRVEEAQTRAETARCELTRARATHAQRQAYEALVRQISALPASRATNEAMEPVERELAEARRESAALDAEEERRARAYRVLQQAVIEFCGQLDDEDGEQQQEEEEEGKERGAHAHGVPR